MPEFEAFFKYNGEIKPVFVFTVDGGLDEHPRYEKTIKVGIHYFQKYDLDCFIVATNSPHRSCFNRVETRMAPLSRELSGVLLPHDKFGNHLNSKLETVDEKLEKQNFKFAGEALAEIWSDVIIDKHVTKAVYIDPDEPQIHLSDLLSKNENWNSKYVLTSQYMTQIVKCGDRSCCTAPRSSIFKLLHKTNGYLP